MEVCSEGRERKRNEKEGQKVSGGEEEKRKGKGKKGKEDGWERRTGEKIHVREERREGEFWVFGSTMTDYM